LLVDEDGSTYKHKYLLIPKYKNMSFDDEVLREIDVFITEDLELYLTQFPLKPVYADSIEIKAAIFKPKCKKFELTIPFSDAALQSFENSKDVSKVQKYVSSTVAQNICLGAGVISNNALHITPIKSVLQMRPSFKNMQGRGETVEDMVDEEKENVDVDGSGEGGLQHVQLKRKESERAQNARTQSYSFMQAQEEAEAWYTLKVNEIGMLNV
jgi:DNA-directed RNA polymerase-3 subunit RPC5